LYYACYATEFVVYDKTGDYEFKKPKVDAKVTGSCCGCGYKYVL